MRTAPPARDLLNPDQLERVRKRSNWRGAYLVLHAWITIAGAMAIFAWFPNPATFILCAMVIGSRQLGLLILMHDGSHGVLCASRRLNDFLSQWLCAFPTIADTFVYRRYHLHHHARTLHKDDPDVVPTGHYPITRASLRRKLLRDLTGRTGLSRRRTQFASALGHREMPVLDRARRLVRVPGRQLATHVALLLICSAIGHWYLYPALWVVPLLTWQQLVLRIRNIAEHAVVGNCDDPFKNARTTLASLLERLFVAPYYVNYHLEHHLMMWAPCYRLPALRELLIANGYGPRMLSVGRYLAVLNQVTVDAPHAAAGPPTERAVGTFSDGFDK